MSIKINSKEYVSWHEAGHAVVCLLLNGNVEFIQLLNAESTKPEGQTRCELMPAIRKHIACGGFAIEYYLYKSGKLEVSEKEFVNNALIKASDDKERFFNGNYEQVDGCWPRHMDIEFRDFAIKKVFPILYVNILVVQKIATTLCEKNYIEGAQIREIMSKY